MNTHLSVYGRPDPDSAFPNPKIPSLCYIKNVVRILQ